jgi:hypothetical protein
VEHSESEADLLPKKYKVCDFDPSVLIEFYRSKDSETVFVRRMRPLQMKDAYMQFLEHLSDNFDDDLLQDALDLLDCIRL